MRTISISIHAASADRLVMREGSEIVLFLFGLAAGGAGNLDLLAGVPLGVAGGVALGFALYVGLEDFPLQDRPISSVEDHRFSPVQDHPISFGEDHLGGSRRSRRRR